MGVYDRAIDANPEPDPEEAKGTLDERSEAADVIINNPLNAINEDATDDNGRIGPGNTVDHRRL